MKTLLLSLLLGFIATSGLWADDTPEELKPAAKLIKQGNYQEATGILKAMMIADATPPRVVAAALPMTMQCLQQLGSHNETEQLIEDAVKHHADQWQVLMAAAASYHDITHYGSLQDGRFTRGGGEGQWTTVMNRDRIRSLQLLLSARRAQPADASLTDKDKLLRTLADAWLTNRPAWKLQILTDFTTLPDYSDREQETQGSVGYPVDAESKPVFFGLPASFEAAANDGERFRFLLSEWAALSPDHALSARATLALLAQDWLSVRSLADVLHNNDVDAVTQHNSIAAVHTLTDDETSARTAVGAMRFTLPAEYAFVHVFRDLLAVDASKAPQVIGPGYQRGTVHLALRAALIEELINRRQFNEAAAVLQAEIASEKDKDRRKGLQEQLAQLVGNWGRFEPLPPQPAGRNAKLAVVFRNATKADFVARKVDVAKLLADTKDYLKSKPTEQDWQRTQLSNIGQQLISKRGYRYLSKPVAQWSTDLQPADKHWDKRSEISTPLTEAGAYLVEATFNGEHPTRALVWLEGLAIVATHQDKGMHYFVCDAVTGVPMPEAKLAFFGYHQEWDYHNGTSRKPTLVYTFDEFTASTDANGVLEVQDTKLNDKQWLITARDAAGRLAFHGFDSMWFSQGDPEAYDRTKVYTITDRPVYRPGQEVKWQTWARQVGYDPKSTTNPFASNPCEYGILDPKGEALMTAKGVADASGSVSGSFTLPADATLGEYHVGAEFNGDAGPRGVVAFRVEEYKKPEFEVKINAPDKPIALGDQFEFTIKADYYFGGAVKEGRVKYKVMRSPHTDHWFPSARWDWLFGSGYSWRNYSYSWYPGAGNWCVCMPRWPWFPWRSDPPELIAEGDTAIGPDGTVKVKIDSALARELHGDQDHRYELTAEVTDQSRRTIFGKGSVLAARRAFETYVSLNRGYYFTGDQGIVEINARTLDGRAIDAKGTLRVFKVTYASDGMPKEESVHEAAITTGEAPASVTLKWFAPGQYRVEAKLTDVAAHEITASQFVQVRGDGFNGRDFHFDDLELLTAKDEYQPGEEVEVVINTNRVGSTVALFVRDMNHAPVWLHLDGKSTTYRFKVSEADQPNLFLEAYTMSDAKLHRQTRQLIVPPSKRIASVELITDKHDYRPRDQAKATLRVKDQDGKPFVGHLVLTGYDKALEYISGGSNVGDIRPFFWGWKRQHSPQISDTLRGLEIGLLKDKELGMVILGDLDPLYPATLTAGGVMTYSGSTARRSEAKEAMPMAMAIAAAPPPAAPADAFAKSGNTTARMDGGGAPSSDAPVMIRSNLADSAVWLASAKTNEAGEATLDFPMPDNLTTWKLRSWVMGPDTQVGEATVDVVTRKDLMVRLQAPRFFVEKDEVIISANVHNETDKALNVRCVQEIAGRALALIEGADVAGSATIEAHGEHRFDWRMKAMQSGEVTITVKALADGLSDAIQMTFPVHEHGTLKTDARSLALRGDQASGSVKFTVPAERKPETASLEVHWSPTLAMAMIDALPYLADYPYGCTEQTLNRFVPTVITLGVLKDLGIDLRQVRDKLTNLNAQEIGDPKKRALRWQTKDHEQKLRAAVFDEDEVKRMAVTGLKRLKAMRDADGGWGWFPGGRESSPHITATVVHGLLAASKTQLVDRNDSAITDGVRWLANYEARELAHLRLPDKHRDHKEWPDDLDALVHSVLVEAGSGDAAMRAKLYEQRNHLARYSVALLGIACDATQEIERRDMCLRNLRQFVKQDDENQTAYLELSNQGWWYWYGDSMETQAAFLRLLCTAEPKGDLAARTAKYLINNRRHGSYWNSTRDTALVIESLATFIKASGESKPDVTVDVVVDGKSMKQVHVTGENLFTFDNTVQIEGDAVTTGEHVIELRKQGSSPIYANAYLTLFSKEDMIPAAGLEVKIARTFYKLTELKTKANVAGARGQAVSQQGMKYERTALASGTPLLSGDLVEVELSIDSKNDYQYVLIADPKPAGFEPIAVQSGWNYEALPSYQEYRDDKVAFFAERLPRGHHVVSYRVKAEIPGLFSALPAKAEAMYAPELRGNSAEWKARIADK